MRYKVTFIVGFAAGFVAGSRAGRERYEQIARMARGVADHPTVQQAAGAIQAQATAFSATARTKVSERLQDKVPWLHPNSGGDQAFTGTQASHDGTPAQH